jgi:hypothetical protein
MGQSYDDITPFSSEKFLDSVFGNSPLVGEPEVLSGDVIQHDITKQDTNRNGRAASDIELLYEEATLKKVRNEDTSERLSQEIDRTPTELPSDSYDSRSNKHESLNTVDSEKLTKQKEQQGQQERHLEQSQPQHSEQQQEHGQKQQEDQKQQSQVITATSDKKPESTTEKNEPGGFFRGLFGRKNKTQDPEKLFKNENHTIKSSHEIDPPSSMESERKSKAKNLAENNEKKIKSQKEGEEVVYLTDEDIEDLLK